MNLDFCFKTFWEWQRSSLAALVSFVILFVVIAAAAIVLGLGGIASICCLFYCPLKKFQAIHARPYNCQLILHFSSPLPNSFPAFRVSIFAD